MILGKQMNSDEAFTLGVANRLSEEGKTLDDAIAFANELVVRPPIATKALLKIFSMSPSVSPEQHLKMEREELAKLFGTKDMVEGMTAFAQKRPPVFKGQ